MANRDLFQPKNENYSYKPQNHQNSNLGKGFIAQMLMATCIFSAMVYLYDNEGTLGNGVRYVVAMAQVQDQNLNTENLMAVGNFFNSSAETDSIETDIIIEETTNINAENETETDLGAGSIEVLPSWADVSTESLTLILPATGMMSANYGDDIDGIASDHLEIYCQGTQTVKSAAIATVIEIHEGEKVVLEHQDNVKTVYSGDLNISVQLGDTIRQGETIATITENTLSFKVLENGLAVNPFLFLSQPE